MKRQAGMSILSALLALVIGAFIAAAQIQATQLESQRSMGRNEGDVLNLLKDAANNYTMENYPALQQDQPVTVKGVTLAAGTGAGQSNAPTVANLVAMEYLPTGTADAALINSGRYRFQLRKIPAGCVALACNVTALVYIDEPVRKPGTADIDGVKIGSLIDRVGGDVLASVNIDPANMRGINGAVAPNPVAGGPAGVVGARAGYGASGFGRFLVVNDPRDPNFQGNLTLAGNLIVGGTSTLNGPVTINNTLDTTGDVTVNNCVKLQADGRGGFNCLDPNDLPGGYNGGVRAIDVVANGKMLVSEAPGAFTGNNGRFAVMDSGNATGEALVATSGKLAANRLVPTGSYSPGTACLEPGASALSTDGAAGSLVLCTGASGSLQWTPVNTAAITGGACALEGQVASDSAGRQLYCFNNIWTPTSDFLQRAVQNGACVVAGAVGYSVPVPGARSTAFICRANLNGGTLQWYRIQDVTTHLVFFGATEVTNDSIVAKPTNCGIGGTPIIQLIPTMESSPDGGTNHYALDYGTYWQVKLLNGAGQPLAGTGGAAAVAQQFCYMS